MNNGLSIYQNKKCEITFLALPCISYIRNIKSSSSGQNNIITSEFATNPLLLQIATILAKHDNICCSFHKTSINCAVR